MNVWLQNPFDNLPLEGYRKQRFWLMAEAFVRAGHRVVLWTSDFSHLNKRPRTLTAAPATFGLELIPTRPYAKNVSLARVRSHRAYAKAWKRQAAAVIAATPTAKPDLIVSSLPTISGAAAALDLGRACGAKVVIDVQDAWPETFERLAPRGCAGLARLALSPFRHEAQRIYREADLVTGVCDRYRALIGRDDYIRSYLGIELTPPPAPVAPPADVLRLVYAGNLGLTYDLGTVIRGLARLDNITLDIAGAGEGEADWKSLVQRLGLGERVRFHGYLGEQQLRQLLARADVGVVPMPSDSFVGLPNKLADYAAAGLGILSSLGGESEALLIRSAAGATYAVGDGKSFQEAVLRLKGQRDGLRTRALALAAQEFDAVRLYDAYVSAILAKLNIA